MMCIKIEVEYLRLTGLYNMRNGYRCIIVDTEAGGAFSPGMVQPPRRMKYVQGTLILRSKVPTFGQSHNSAQRHQCATGNQRRYLMHAWLHGCVTISKAKLQL